MTPEQLEQARARMKRARDVRAQKRLHVDEVSGAVAVAVPPSYDLVFGIRRIHTGSFSGLWELVKFDMQGDIVKSHEVLVDADLKPVVMANILKMIRAS